ncbi:MAG: hypothetical protein QGI61_14070, partial [Alphaproteobacteria bacterium]|nr:hypothetical protein [Alphaproteobacteria bacterium]
VKLARLIAHSPVLVPFFYLASAATANHNAGDLGAERRHMSEGSKSRPCTLRPLFEGSSNLIVMSIANRNLILFLN